MTAERLVADLLASGVSKSELSVRSGVSRSLIDDYLAGRRQPSLAQVERLGAAVSLRLDFAWAPVEATADVPSAADAMPLSLAGRAQVLERVVAAGMALPRRERGELTFPPFRTLTVAGRPNATAGS